MLTDSAVSSGALSLSDPTNKGGGVIVIFILFKVYGLSSSFAIIFYLSSRNYGSPRGFWYFVWEKACQDFEWGKARLNFAASSKIKRFIYFLVAMIIHLFV